MERIKLINSINKELDELKIKLSEESYNRFINNKLIKRYHRLINKKILNRLLSNLYLKQIYAYVHERNYY